MQAKTKRLISAVLALTMILAWYVPSAVSAEETPEFLFKEDFGLGTAYTFTAWTGATTQGISVSNANCVGMVQEGANTVLHVNVPASKDCNVDARFDTSGTKWDDNATFMKNYKEKSIVYQFKFKAVQNPAINVQLRARHDADNNGAVSTEVKTVFTIDANGAATAFDKKINQTFKTGTWYDIALVFDFKNNSAAIYINGTKVEGNFTIPGNLNHTTAKLNPLLRFKDSAADTEYYLDDIAVYAGTAPIGQAGKTEYFSENFATGFTTVTNGKGIQNASVKGLVSHFTESDGNHALKVNMGDVTVSGNTFQINTRYNPSGAWENDNSELYDVHGKTLICQFMIKINTSANFNVALRTYNNGTKLIVPIRVNNNVLKLGSSETPAATLTAGKWYSIATAIVFPAEGTSDIQNHVYLDGEYMGNYPVRVDQNDLSKANYMVRFYGNNNEQNFLLDNIAVYEASEVDHAFFGGSFTSNSVTLNAKLGVNFYTTATGTVKVSNTNGETAPVVATSADAADSDGDWKHTVRVLPQYMMNEMTAGLYGADGELITTDTFKLSDYVSDVKANYAAWANLADKLQQYCTAAAIKEGKYTDNNFSVSAISPNLDAYADTLVEGVKTQVVLDDACDLKIWIPAEYADAMLTVDGKEIGVVKDVCALDESDNTYGYAVAKELLPQSYDKQYQVTVGEHSCQISVLGWMQRYIPNNTAATSTNQLAWALYEYYVAAEAMAP